MFEDSEEAAEASYRRASTCEGLARNPAAAPAIRFAFILAMVLIESMALYTFAIVAINIFW